MIGEVYHENPRVSSDVSPNREHWPGVTLTLELNALVLFLYQKASLVHEFHNIMI